MMQAISRLLCLIITLWLVAVNAVAAARPNVLIIYADDQGSIDLNCYGATDLQTPHLDRLAGGGVRFTQMYAPAPVCSASRVGLLTGRFPVRAGQPANGPLDGSELTLAEVFRDAGYATGLVGKWHLGTQADQLPQAQGFESSYGHLQGCIDNYSHFFMWSGPNRHDLWRNGREVFEDGKFFPDLMVRECKAFLDAHQDEPFLLYWAFNAPHYPYQGTEPWRTQYEGLPHPRDKYAAFVSTMDDRIGQVLDHLQRLGLAENTIVVFQPDHGHSTETRAFGGGGNSGPYRGAKFSLFEGGIRVPAIVRWPGHIPADEVRDQLVTGCDWFATLCDMCSVDRPDVHLDGKSIESVIADAQAPSPHRVWQWQMGRGDNPQWAVRKGDWKLIANPLDTTLPQGNRPRGGRLEADRFLVNLRHDPGEKTNLAERFPERVRELEAERRK